MATLKLKIVVLDTHDITTMCIDDASTYPTEPPVVTNPILLVEPPGYPLVSLPFLVQDRNYITSDILGITSPIGNTQPLPDGFYRLSYSVSPSATYFHTISIMRVDKLQEKFDKVFLTLDMMVCDGAIKSQAKVNLYSIYLLIQGAMAAANACAITEANKLYDKASSMLDTMLSRNCGCTGNNFVINFN